MNRVFEKIIENLEEIRVKQTCNNEQRTLWKCPQCGAYTIKVEFFTGDGSESHNKASHCWSCGQAIDWSEDES